MSDIEQPLAERMTQPTDGSIQPIQVTEQEKKAVAENDRMCSLLSTILYNANLPQTMVLEANCMTIARTTLKQIFD